MLVSRYTDYPRILPIDEGFEDFLSNVVDRVAPTQFFEDFFDPFRFSMRPYRRQPRETKYVISINIGPHYQMKDITTKFEGKKLIVNGDTVSSLKHGSDAHSFQREYDIPDDVILDSMKASLSPEGVLHIVFDRKHLGPLKEIEDLSKDKEFKIKVPLHGYKPEETTVKLVGRNLIIEAGRKCETCEGQTQCFSSGFSSRTIRLGDEVDIDKLKVISKDCCLEIFGPRDMARINPAERKLAIEK